MVMKLMRILMVVVVWNCKKTYVFSQSDKSISTKNWTPNPNQTQTPRSVDTLKEAGANRVKSIFICMQ